MINHFAAVLLLALAAPASAAVSSPLAAYKGVARVLVLSASSPTNSAMATENRLLAAQDAGLREREVVVIRIVGEVVTGPEGAGGDARVWRDAAGVPSRRFAVALIGKDGTQAFEEEQPIKPKELFKRIDVMPMRREEMAHRKR